jgi:hypothetical protein
MRSQIAYFAFFAQHFYELSYLAAEHLQVLLFPEDHAQFSGKASMETNGFVLPPLDHMASIAQIKQRFDGQRCDARYMCERVLRIVEETA